MNVLIYGAGNWIAIGAAAYLCRTGHNVILADTGRYYRAFYSRYCKKRYIFRDPYRDREGFFADLHDCVRLEDVNILLPSSDRSLFELLEVGGEIGNIVKVPVPLCREKIGLVTNKRNISSICKGAGIDAIPTCTVEDFAGSGLKGVPPPYVLKPYYALSGEGLIAVADQERLTSELDRIRGAGREKSYLVQKYIKGDVYGAGGVYEDGFLKHFYSYRYVRRHSAAGQPTICTIDFRDCIRESMSNVLEYLHWEGFCHMDFIVEEKSGIPFLTDINPVHSYSVPCSLSKKLNSLNFYLGEDYQESSAVNEKLGFYTTLSITRELQRILTGRIFRKTNIPADISYLRCLRGLKSADFYWDPLPIVLAPFLRVLRWVASF